MSQILTHQVSVLLVLTSLYTLVRNLSTYRSCPLLHQFFAYAYGKGIVMFSNLMFSSSSKGELWSVVSALKATYSLLSRRDLVQYPIGKLSTRMQIGLFHVVLIISLLQFLLCVFFFVLFYISFYLYCYPNQLSVGFICQIK